MKKVTVSEFLDELEDMLGTCFEGTVQRDGDEILVILPGGETFRISVAQ